MRAPEAYRLMPRKIKVRGISFWRALVGGPDGRSRAIYVGGRPPHGPYSVSVWIDGWDDPDRDVSEALDDRVRQAAVVLGDLMDAAPVA